jgi:hypothetical protein
MKKTVSLLILAIFLLLNGCSSPKDLSQSVQKVSPKFDYGAPSNLGIGSANMSIAIVKPVFITDKPEYLVSPFPEMATSMGNDFEELLSAKGFTMKGPFSSRDQMVYTEKLNTSFIIEIQIDFNYQINQSYISHTEFGFLNILFLEGPSFKYSTKGTLTFNGNLVLTAISPQYGEKIWKKNLALESNTFTYTGAKLWRLTPNIADQLREDNVFYNQFSSELDKFYTNALNTVWQQIDINEMKIIAKQSKEADEKSK